MIVFPPPGEGPLPERLVLVKPSEFRAAQLRAEKCTGCGLVSFFGTPSPEFRLA